MKLLSIGFRSLGTFALSFSMGAKQLHALIYSPKLTMANEYTGCLTVNCLLSTAV